MLEVPGYVKVLSKLLQAGMAAWDAIQSRGIDNKEGTVLRLATDLLVDLGGKRSGEFTNMEDLHFGIVTQCFGYALGRQWAFNKKLAPTGLRLFMDKEQRERANEIELRMRLADSSLPKSGAALQQPGDLRSSVEEVRAADALSAPLSTPYYQSLWSSFTHPKLDEGDEARVPLIDMEKGRLGFERDFLLAYQQVLATSDGQQLQRYVDGVTGDFRAETLRELLLRDMAGWDERHTFGNLERHDRPEDDPIPFMPLGKVYVEPVACMLTKSQQGKDAPQEPVLSLIDHWLQESATNVVVVRADFGMGKSLTARTLAQRRARRFLDARTPSSNEEMPVFIRCAEDLTEEGFDLDGFVRRAWKREASELGLRLKLDDPALAPPGRMQRALFILDGLDEVILGERRLESFFQRIKDEASEQHRFIIFSRPGALPGEREMDGIPVLEIQPWDEPQIAAWLDAWRGLIGEAGPTPTALKERRLGELATTPILLFMIAQTWSGQSREASASRSALYEEFFWRIASGKHEADRRQHRNVFEASTKLHRHLVQRGWVAKSTEPPDAMLWLMGRVAWEATKLDQRQMLEPLRKADVLTKHGITNLLINELGMDDSASDTIEAIQVGLLLTLQAHLRSGAASQLLFGHKSFREFLVARYWADRLKALAQASSRDWEEIESPLLGGRLLSREDRTFEFLLEMLDGEPHPRREAASFGLTEVERGALLQWAQDRFESEEPEAPISSARGGRSRPPSLRDDRRPWLREAALAIGSSLRGSPGMKQRDKLTMRSMLAWFWLMRIGPIIVARKAYLAGASMPNLTIRGADFSEANLQKADFSHTDMQPGHISSEVVRFFTSFAGATLDDARLIGANLSGCLFEGTSLRRAVLTGADISGALFTEAMLDGASMEFVDGAHARFTGANLTAAILLRAHLKKTSFVNANLQRASLDAARLHGTNFKGAVLEGASLRDARYDDETIWPDGFDPVAAGAIRAPD
ncbi:pentapeptide repeat-containing protein [Corallococcus macrosporus]|uniref:Pentapeptide repeat protein n=1 Tax=Myxococcus fulvus (strain ATCC BAA-855 / HW-1) TaxID=483219 RepID=F8CFT2_MYXFH|nr:pentapeptide repeat-containing protein [Corallococcus macrosporus]AEI64901.1 pentapeptide repeat protein [Corallococcus macrosporus]